MSYKSKISTALAAAIVFVAAGDPATQGGALAQSSDSKMPAMPPKPAAAEHAATGTVNAIDRDKGTVNISHNAVATAQWPAMTMTFKLPNPAAVPADVVAGQKVAFKFTIEGGMSATVTSIKKAE
jgi:Cu(I)/Ag(I) efflux system membrane fusion protein/Cu(I)/Ag(I) efflux system protein CusF